MTKRTTGFLLMLMISLSLASQTAPNTWWVQFTDKTDSPYSILRPEEFLSQRSVERRNRFGIQVTEQDLPVNTEYIDSLKSAGLQILAKSKWFNAVTVFSTDTLLIQSLSTWTFIRQVKSGGKKVTGKSGNDKFAMEESSLQTEQKLTDTTLLRYGEATRQIGMLNGHILHNQGYMGQGMLIAVLDAGFWNANQNPAFDSLWQGGQIVSSWSFVNRGPVTSTGHRHGSQVLSVMGSNMPGQLVGSAPKASYILLHTEDVASEYLVEEDYWVAGAEYADSAGADLINSSLGYSRFDDPAMNHTYADMDGNSTRITMAADIAASKGILVVTSAANEGQSDWHYITAPADADSVLTVGAVDSLGQYAAFSSTGPTYDGRIKPNVAGQGLMTAIASSDGSVVRGNGTSFSSPLVCGLVACLWQSNRSVHPADLIRLIEQSSSQSMNPDSLLGYGLPDFGKALFLIQGLDPVKLDGEHLIRTFPNPFSEGFVVDFYSPEHQDISVQILNLSGQVLWNRVYHVGLTSLNHLHINETDKLPEGMLLLRIISGKKSYSSRILHFR